MVVLAGSELFTGNCLLIIPLLEREIRLRALLRLSKTAQHFADGQVCP